MVDDFMVLEEG